MRTVVASVLLAVLTVSEVRCEPKKDTGDIQKAEDHNHNRYVAPGSYIQNRPGYADGRYNQGYYPGGRYDTGYNNPYGGYGIGNNYRQGGRYGGYNQNQYGRYGMDYYNRGYEGSYGMYGTGRYPYNTAYNQGHQGYGTGRYPYNTAYNQGHQGYGTGRYDMSYGSYGYGNPMRPQGVTAGQFGFSGSYGGAGSYGPNSGYGRGDFGRSYGQLGMPGMMAYGGLYDSFGGPNVHSGRSSYQFSTAHEMPAQPAKQK